MFSQCLAVLFQRTPTLEELEAALSRFSIVNRTGGGEHWAFGGPSVVLEYRPDVNGYLSVDICNHPWPDPMGDTQTEKMIFGAWALGHFGPGAYPGSLQRAAQQAWQWPEGSTAAERHRSFVRVRSSYVFGARGDMPVLPPDYEALPELMFVTRVARAALEIEGALALFNPNGECLANATVMDESIGRFQAGGPVPQELWANVRLLRLEGLGSWVLMDTVGMGQLDTPDHEACCDGEAFDLSEVASFLRNAADYVRENGEIIQDGDTMDGPGGIRWQGASFGEGLAAPPRRVIRWLPLDGRQRPRGVQGEDDEGAGEQGVGPDVRRAGQRAGRVALS